MLPSSRSECVKLFVGAFLLGLVLAVTLWMVFSGRLPKATWRLIELWGNRDEIRDYLESWGVWAPIVFIFMQSLQVVVAPIPGEVTGFIGGFVFGTIHGAIYSTLGLALGSAVEFSAARIMGLPLVKLIVKQDTLEKFHFLAERRGALGTLVLFAFPGFPKDILSYLLGLCPMSFSTFIIVCGLGRIPGTIMLALSGSALYKENWGLIVGLSVACAILAIVLYVKGDKIRDWTRKRSSPPQHDSSGPASS
jgi:uncharacterized membrane protein YdjX (TVP38/TMEM64 family)